jgi:hypothetical protein
MEHEITESAKAIQEVAKATRIGIEATQKLGGFVSKIINEPLEAVVGILTDRLQHIRAERQLRLVDRWREIISQRRLEGTLRIVPPKLALPIIENASLEEDDELQDLWANLLASAVDPNFNKPIRTAYVDIIKELEVIDVHVLNFIYWDYMDWRKKREASGFVDRIFLSPIRHGVNKNQIVERLSIDTDIYETSIDNLMRVRCIASYIQDDDDEYYDYENEFEYKEAQEDKSPSRWGSASYVTYDHRYQWVCMTALGVNFVEACTIFRQGRRSDSV